MANQGKIESLIRHSKETDLLIDVKSPLKKGEGSTHYGGLDSNEEDELLLGAHVEAEIPQHVRIIRVLRSMTIEPVLFSTFFSYAMTMTCLTNMMMDKGCLYHLNFTEEVCRNLSGHPKEKDEVEILANNYSLYVNLMNLLAAVMMIFIAPWSDRYGRKLPMMVTFFGYLITDLGLVLCAFYFESKLYYLIVVKIPSELCGGLICILTMVFSHVSEVSTEKTRTLKNTSIEIMMGLGMSLGMFAGGMIYTYFGYVYVFVLEAAVHVFCFFWVALVVQETRGMDIVATMKEKTWDFFTFENLTTGWKASIRPRPNYGRALIFLYYASGCVLIMTYESYGSCGFVYTHHIFNWDVATFNTVSTVSMLVELVVMLVTAHLLIRVFKMKDSTIGVIGAVSQIAKNLLFAFALGRVYLYYTGLVCGCWSDFSSLALRSGLSSVADKEELGRVFAFLSMLQAAYPMVSGFLVTKVFNATINVFPSVLYLMMVFFLVLPLGTFMFAHLKKRKYSETSLRK